MKRLVASILPIIISFFFTDGGEASWLIDRERLHVSVHGQISCQDCHKDITEKKPHPNPEDVNKTLKAFFQLEQCIDCHAEALDEISEGTHGGESNTNKHWSDVCIDCHDPHYQATYAESTPHADLSQPVQKKCSLCHEFQKNLPELSLEDQHCMSCHLGTNSATPQAAKTSTNLCFHCHGKNQPDGLNESSVRYALIDVDAYQSTAHHDISCMACHRRSAEFKHKEKELASCRQCHLKHDAKVAHDVHLSVECGACHLNEITPIKNPLANAIQWQKNSRPGTISRIHQMVASTQDHFCRRCHFSGNALGAAEMVLPAKSIICMPCHAATFSVDDTTTILALVIFILGVLILGSVWFSGNPGNRTESGISSKIIHTTRAILTAIFSARIVSIFKVLTLDGLLQRKLYRISKTRWSIHALIFYPFVLRFSWGLLALILSLWIPEKSGAWLLLDKNHPVTAFVFDLTGVMVILGIVLILIRKGLSISKEKLEGLPRADWPAYSLLGGIIIIGFILEGMRIAMTGTPQGSQYAFLGEAVSRLFAGTDLTGLYGYTWYLHAILTGIFVAYLPFSRMFHLIIAPVSLAINAVSDAHNPAR